MFIDVHCHMDSLEDVAAAVKKAKQARVEMMVTQGTQIKSNNSALELGKKFPEILVALGLYPIHAIAMSEREIDSVVSDIKKNKKRIVAIGEVGLDLKEDTEQFDKQQRAFQKMIDLSLEFDKPIIVHSRKAELQAIEQLEKSGTKRVLMHCFSGKLSLVKRIVENKWFLSIPTSVKNSEHFQKVIEMTPIEQLLCETDTPYLHPDRLFPNEPANVVVSYEMIAKIKKLKLEDVEKQLEANFKKLFQ
jgi:TatD DNase family protein